MSEARIVVHDPSGNLAEGTVVEGEAKCRLLEVKDVVALPVSLERLCSGGAVGACGAYVRRSFGRPGIQAPYERPGMICPTAIFLERGAHRLCSEFGVGDAFPLGWLVMSGDASIASGRQPRDTIIRADNDGFIVIGLYGMADSFVEWVALTLLPA